MKQQYDVHKDRFKVWVNGPFNCLARFSPYLMEVFPKLSHEVDGDVLLRPVAICATKGSTIEDWEKFKGMVRQTHHLILDDYHMPDFVK